MTGKFLEYLSKYVTVAEPIRDTNFSIANQSSSNQIFTENT